MRVVLRAVVVALALAPAYSARNVGDTDQDTGGDPFMAKVLSNLNASKRGAGQRRDPRKATQLRDEGAARRRSTGDAELDRRLASALPVRTSKTPRGASREIGDDAEEFAMTGPQDSTFGGSVTPEQFDPSRSPPAKVNPGRPGGSSCSGKCPGSQMCYYGECKCPAVFSGPDCKNRLPALGQCVATLPGNWFTKVNVLRAANWTTCAVVGSGLSKQNLGPPIDAHSAVIRFNDAPTRNYVQKVGKKTTLRIQNRDHCGFAEKPGELCLFYSMTPFSTWGNTNCMAKLQRPSGKCNMVLPALRVRQATLDYWKMFPRPDPKVNPGRICTRQDMEKKKLMNELKSKGYTARRIPGPAPANAAPARASRAPRSKRAPTPAPARKASLASSSGGGYYLPVTSLTPKGTQIPQFIPSAAYKAAMKSAASTDVGYGGQGSVVRTTTTRQYVTGPDGKPQEITRVQTQTMPRKGSSVPWASSGRRLLDEYAASAGSSGGRRLRDWANTTRGALEGSAQQGIEHNTGRRLSALPIKHARAASGRTPSSISVEEVNCQTGKISAGFYGVLLAAHLCQEVNVYLFTGTKGHYYQKKYLGSLEFAERHLWESEQICLRKALNSLPTVNFHSATTMTL